MVRTRDWARSDEGHIARVLERGVAGLFVKASGGRCFGFGLAGLVSCLCDFLAVLCWVWVLVAFWVLVGACRSGAVLCSGIVFGNTHCARAQGLCHPCFSHVCKRCTKMCIVLAGAHTL
jgi:hypothetical protein